MWLLNALSLQRDTDPKHTSTTGSIKFENLCGIGILIYVADDDLGAIDWIKSLDVTWYSSIYGLLFLVGQGYAVLALGILTVLCLGSEPMKTMLRTTEQHDLGKLAFAFVMLNIYLCVFAVPDHLVGQYSGRDSLVSEPHSRRMVGCLLAGLHLPLADSVYALAVARSEAQSWPTDAGVPVDDLRSLLGYVLADRAELPGCGAQSSLQLWNSGVHYRARCSDLRLAGLLLHPAAEAGRWLLSTIRTWKRFWSLNMPMHNSHDPKTYGKVPEEDRSLGYETTDVNVQGVLVFLVALFVFLGVFFVFCFGMGKVINNALVKGDGPPNKWNQIAIALQARASWTTWLPTRRCSSSSFRR